METRIMQQRQKVIELPRTDDIQRLSEYLDKKISKNRKKLKTNFSKLVWRDLAEALLAQLQLFNRKRAGELERFEIQDYEKMTFITEKDEGYELLSESDKKAAKEYGRATICGKLHKNVPLLLNSKVRKGLIELLKFRTEAGVSSRNPFVFGIAGYYKDSHLCASTVLRKFSEECGAERPDLLRGTGLCKQLATKCTELQLNPGEVSKVADYLGHDINIHKNIYQQRAKSDILNMSKILHIAQKPDRSADDSTISMNSTHNLETENSTNASFPDTSSNNQSHVDDHQDKSDTVNSSKDSNFKITSKAKVTFKTQVTKNSAESKKITRARWSEDEKKTIQRYFAEYLRTKSLPSFQLIKKFKAQYNILPGRSPQIIKTYISNFHRTMPKVNQINKSEKNKSQFHSNDKKNYF
ncbi:uncharacterized protein LOC130673231 [Microplitis mediator]|uniref:uncharacterized protein LOC130673231 n=1 Tax=Microplitis mediator TaxID=375433 RepID=UPI0025549E87|nr:uncharacterized protein LOC130673231 [Microplitis mediator]